jgi:hypothetical protein
VFIQKCCGKNTEGWSALIMEFSGPRSQTIAISEISKSSRKHVNIHFQENLKSQQNTS